MKKIESESPFAGHAGKNSPFRKIFKRPVNSISRHLHEVIPGATPNEITLAGFVSVGIGGVIMESENKKAKKDRKVMWWLSLVLQMLGYACDAVDGGVAGIIEKETPGKHNKAFGAVLDVTTDRLQESFLALLRSKSAAERNDLPGMLAADGVALTTSLPTIVRELTMWLDGHEVREVGTNVLAFPGSRIGRIFLNTASGAMPERQPALDTAQIVANLYSAYNRYTNRGELIDDKSRIVSREKLIGLIPAAVLAAAAIPKVTPIEVYRRVKKNRTSFKTY